MEIIVFTPWLYKGIGAVITTVVLWPCKCYVVIFSPLLCYVWKRTSRFRDLSVVLLCCVSETSGNHACPWQKLVSQYEIQL